MMSIFTSHDLEQIKKRGSKADEVERQFACFSTGFPYSNLDRPATVDDGILRKSGGEVAAAIASYETDFAQEQIVKFVPASGAASRMFKSLFDMIDKDDEVAIVKGRDFLQTLKLYPFYRDLAHVMQNRGLFLKDLISQGDYKTIIRHILFEEGLNYSQKPKALLKFFDYGTKTRYAVEEHLVEAARYAKSSDGKCYLHFTVSSHHLDEFERVIEDVKPNYEQRFGVKYEVSYSLQDPATDTLAATENNQPFRDEDGELLFRPGGHGALIGNLNKLDADIIFVKNIDNITDESHIEDTVTYKKFLASQLRRIRNEIFNDVGRLQNENTQEIEKSVKEFVKMQLGVKIPENYTKLDLIRFLDRPIRVCGMVKNEGEPGGGPFWVRHADGNSSLQIVETSQINKTDPVQKAMLEQATHFNPVDMVCSIKNHQGKKYNLKEFVDDHSGFISEKSHNGKILKAMELPGLWNGAMADWITIFVEVPLSTFNPVKTVEDLRNMMTQ
ncbi:MAG: DUF4301 family protein [Bacteroidales bacterium]|nr:DUF4301 family protein [Bacteroidales bacterium]